MPQEGEKKKKRNPELRKKRRKKVLIGSFGITVITLSIVTLVLYFYGNALLRNFIINTVESRSNGMYRVEIGEISVSFLDQGFEVKGFHLIPDLGIYRDRKARGKVKTGLYDISIPNFKLRGLRLLTAFYENSFIINSMVIDRPDLKLLDIPIFKKEEDYKEGYDDIRPIIIELVEYFRVRDLRINEGVFDIFLDEGGNTENFTASKISLRLLNFQVDKKNLDGQEKFLYSDGAELVFKDYKIYLKDEIHIIEANEIGINTLDSLVYARGLNMGPGQKSIADLRKQEVSYFSAFLPEILLKGADVIHAYEKDTFNIRDILILRPKINYFNQTPLNERVRSAKTLRSQIDIYPLIKGLLKQVNIKEFRLEKGNFKYVEPMENIPENITISGIDVVLVDFMVDSGAFQMPDRILYSNDMNLDLNSFKMTLRDSIHVLEAKSLLISSSERKISANKLRIRPGIQNASKSGKDLMDISLPEIEFSGLDLFSLYLKRELIAEKLLVKDPVVDVEIWQSKVLTDSADKKSAGDIYLLLERYLKSSKINLLELSNGSIDFKQRITGKTEQIEADNISLRLYNFLLDSASFQTGHQFLFSENLDFSVRDYDFVLPDDINEIRVGNMEFSSLKREVRLENISMRALKKDSIRQRLARRKKSGYIEFDIPSIVMSDADILRALKNQNVEISSVKIQKPKIQSYSYPSLKLDSILPPSTSEIRDLIRSSIPFLKVKSIDLEDGVFSAFANQGDSMSLQFVNDFSLDLKYFQLLPDSLEERKKELFFSGGVRMVLRNQNLFIRDNEHIISSDSIVYTFPEEKVQIRNFDLKPLNDTPKSPFIMKVESPNAVFGGVNLDKLYNHQILDVTSGSFDTINIYMKHTNFEMPLKEEEVFSMPELMSELHLKSLNFEYGTFDYFLSDDREIASGNFRGKIVNSSITDKTVGDSVTGLPFDSIRFILPQLNVNLHSAHHKLKFKEIDFDLGHNYLKTGRVSINVDSTFLDSINVSKLPFVNTGIDSVKITGLNLRPYYVHRDISIDTIRFWHPDIDFHHYPDTSSKPSLKQIDIYPRISEFANHLSVNEILMLDGAVRRYNHQLDSNQLRASLDGIYIDFSGFLIDSLSLERDQFLFSEDLKLRLKDYEKILPGEMNKIIFDEVGLSTGDSRIYAMGTHLEPLYNKYDYSRILGFQNDRIEARFGDIEIIGVDLDKFYHQNELRAQELKIDSFFIDDYRDKRVEMREDFRPPIIHELIRNIPIDFSLDSITIINGNALYQEFSTDGVEPGLVYFNNLNGKIYRVSNDSAFYEDKPPMYLFASGMLMNEGKIFMEANFNLLDTNNTFDISGNMGEMDMSAVNPMLENVAYVTIKSGKVQSINFQFRADEDIAQGDLNFKYSKFKIFIINKKTGEPEGLDEGIVSWFANTFLINRRNPHFGFFKEGEVFFRRDKQKSIVNYVWKSIYSGIKTSIGAQTQKKLHKIAEKQQKAEEKRKAEE